MREFHWSIRVTITVFLHPLHWMTSRELFLFQLLQIIPSSMLPLHRTASEPYITRWVIDSIRRRRTIVHFRLHKFPCPHSRCCYRGERGPEGVHVPLIKCPLYNRSLWVSVSHSLGKWIYGRADSVCKSQGWPSYAVEDDTMSLCSRVKVKSISREDSPMSQLLTFIRSNGLK